MIIKSVKYKEIVDCSEDKLSAGFNLITSNNINSVGKSTYCRLLFYALGYPVPATDNIKFGRIKTSLEIEEGGKLFIVSRDGNVLTAINQLDNFERSFDLPNQHISFLSFLFGIDNPFIVKNLLGLMYIDQEKGWTFLNRGKVIGGIKFSIDELIAALKGDDFEDLFSKRALLENTVERYQSILKMNAIKEEYYANSDSLNPITLSDDLKRRMASVHLAIQELKNDIADIDSVIQKDQEFFNYIESMNLYVRNGEDLIKITKDNIENACSLEYLKAQKAILEMRLRKLNREKVKLQRELDIDLQIDLLGDNPITNAEKRINQALGSVDIDVNAVTQLLSKSKQELYSVEENIKIKLKYTNEYITKIYNLFYEYATVLGVENSISNKTDYIFTRDIKCKTGANFQKLILAFKMAVLKVVESVVGIKLLLVIDSPKAKELDDTNTKAIMEFLKSILSENQVIVASIYPEEQLFTKFDNVICLQKRAIESRGN